MWVGRPVKYGYTNALCRTLKASLIERSVFERLTTATTLGDIFIVLKETPYKKFIKTALEEPMLKGLKNYFSYLYLKVTEKLSEEEKTLFYLFFMKKEEIQKQKNRLKNRKNAKELFKKLDREYVEELVKAIMVLPKSERRDLKKIAGSYFDVVNILTVLRLKFIYQFQNKDVKEFFIPFGFKFDEETLEKVLKLEKLSEIASCLPEIFEREVGDFTDIRKELFRYHLKVINQVWFGFPFKLSVPCALLRLKEIEIKNLKACIEGVYFGLPEEEIERMLVGV